MSPLFAIGALLTTPVALNLSMSPVGITTPWGMVPAFPVNTLARTARSLFALCTRLRPGSVSRTQSMSPAMVTLSGSPAALRGLGGAMTVPRARS